MQVSRTRYNFLSFLIAAVLFMSELDEIRSILLTVAQQQQQSQVRMEQFQADLQRTQQLIDSNARAIEANSAGIIELRATLQANSADLVQMLTQFATEAAEDRVLIRQEMQGIRSELREIGSLVREMYGERRNGNPPVN